MLLECVGCCEVAGFLLSDFELLSDGIDSRRHGTCTNCEGIRNNVVRRGELTLCNEGEKTENG